MRDRVTAAIGIEASLTGHLVPDAPANSAPETLTRLIGMDIDTRPRRRVRGVLAQRLVRKLCDAYRAPQYRRRRPRSGRRSATPTATTPFAADGRPRQRAEDLPPGGLRAAGAAGHPPGASRSTELLPGTESASRPGKRAPLEELRHAAATEGVRHGDGTAWRRCSRGDFYECARREYEDRGAEPFGRAAAPQAGPSTRVRGAGE